LITVVLYATLSLIVYAMNRVAATYSLRLQSSRIVRPCCLADRYQSFGGTSSLHLQDIRVIVRSCSLVDTNVSRRVECLIGIWKRFGASFLRAEHRILCRVVCEMCFSLEESDASINASEGIGVSIFRFRITNVTSCSLPITRRESQKTVMYFLSEAVCVATSTALLRLPQVSL
jgi:hypothetical protein